MMHHSLVLTRTQDVPKLLIDAFDRCFKLWHLRKFLITWTHDEIQNERIYCTMIKSYAKSILKFYRRFLKRFVYVSHKKRLVNQTPTIISSNCIGGVICNNLGLRFHSPTVNLYILNDDFFAFVSDLKGYLSCELEEVVDSGETFPIGTLTYNNKTITIYFLHYKSFEEAKNKWNERKERVDFSNIYIIHLIPMPTKEEVDRFERLPFEHKMLISLTNPTDSKYIVTHKILSREHARPGSILEYKSVLAPKRYIDDIDYVSFLNEGTLKMNGTNESRKE